MIERVRGAFLGALRGWRLTAEDPAFLSFLHGGAESDAGVKITCESAMRLSTVFACIQKISKTIGQIPVHVVRRNEGSGSAKKIHATNHPLYSILHRRPNPRMTSLQFRQMMQWHATGRGNAVAQIVRDKAGRILELWPWPVSKVRIEADGWELKFYFQTKRGEVRVAEEDVFHLPGICIDGRIGVSPIQAARETLGEGMALQQHSARLLKNGLRASGVIETDPNGDFKTLEDKKNWVKQFRESLTGENAYKIALLKPGMKFTPTMISHEDAQWIEARKFNQVEICSIFDIPPHMIGNLDRATFSNIEQQSLEFILYSIASWLVNWEQQLELQLLTPDEAEVYEVKFNFDGLLRGDSKARWDAYWRSVQIGAKSPNEVRDLEDMNPYPGGDKKFIMANLTEIGESASPAVDADPETK